VTNPINLTPIHDYFVKTLEEHGPTPKGVDYNSALAQEKRFDQLMKVIESNQRYSFLDFGSGYGAMYDYMLSRGHKLTYYGLDIVQEMVDEGYRLHKGDSDCMFYTTEKDIPLVDYSAASGTFNMKLEADNNNWTDLVIDCISNMNKHSTKGFSFNMLTKYSDPAFMKPQLYYADPCFFFDYCKLHFSRNVALLHDYTLYDFTILVRKDIP
jgi:SAM-dependent methyltransferase